jgi:hypothetical protein
MRTAGRIFFISGPPTQPLGTAWQEKTPQGTLALAAHLQTHLTPTLRFGPNSSQRKPGRENGRQRRAHTQNRRVGHPAKNGDGWRVASGEQRRSRFLTSFGITTHQERQKGDGRDYRFAPKASRRPSQSFTANSRMCHGVLASPRLNSTPWAAYSA